MPINVNKPLPNNQIEAGTGTDEILLTVRVVISRLVLKPTNGPLSSGEPPIPSSVPRVSWPNVVPNLVWPAVLNAEVAIGTGPTG